MTTEEKRISFMNRYFVFRKARNVNTDKVYKLIVEENVVDKYREKSEEEEKKIEKKEGGHEKEDTIKTIKKSKAKITISEMPAESVEPEIMKIKVKKSKK
jgi:hypothetical protein